MNPIYNFKGQVALVTGAAKGMGLATARMFAQSGASVVLADLDGNLAAKEAERIVVEGGTAIWERQRIPTAATFRAARFQYAPLNGGGINRSQSKTVAFVRCLHRCLRPLPACVFAPCHVTLAAMHRCLRHRPPCSPRP